MRLTTWNVNGIRNPFGYQPWSTDRTFSAMFDILQADIIVMQELKIQRKDLRDDMVLIDGWDCYFSLPKQKKGYSGVGIYTRNATCAPIRAEEGILGVLTPPNSSTAYRDLPDSAHIGGYPSEIQIAEFGVPIDPAMLDSEGRCVCLEFPAFVLFGVYSPANSNGLRDDFRYGFLCALDCRIRNLEKMGKRVVLVGDLNVSRGEIDTAGAADELRKTGTSHEDYISTPNRRIFNQLIVGGEVIGERDEGREQPVLMDIVRDFHPHRQGMYTHWEQKVNARPGNFGSRIDFVLASRKMDGWFSGGDIQEGLMGSDHCPVYGQFKNVVQLQGDGEPREISLVDIMNPPGVFRSGARRKPWNVKEVPPLSAKLMPEFYQRRSIKDMFKKPSAPRTTSSAQSPPSATPPPNAETLSLPQPASEHESVPSDTSSQLISSSINPIPQSPGSKRKASETPGPKPTKKQKSTSAPPSKSAPAKGQQSLKGFFQPKPTSKASQQNSNAEMMAHRRPSNESGVANGCASREAGPGTDESVSAEDDAVLMPQTVFDASLCSALGSIAHLHDHTYSERKVSTTEGDDISGTSTYPADHTTDPSDTAKSGNTAEPGNNTSTASGTSHARTPTKPAQSSPFSFKPSPSALDAETVHDPIVSKESWDSLFKKRAAPLCEGHDEPCKSMLTKKKGENQGRSFWMCSRPLGPSGQKEKGSEWRCGTFIWCSDRK